MSEEELNAISLKWLEAFNAHNLEKLLGLYHEDALHYSPKLKIRHPETNGFIKGTYALKIWWQEAFVRLPSLRYQVIRLTPYDDRVFMEYTRHVTGEVDMHVGEMLEIKDGKIIASSVFHR